MTAMNRSSSSDNVGASTHGNVRTTSKLLAIAWNVHTTEVALACSQVTLGRSGDCSILQLSPCPASSSVAHAHDRTTARAEAEIVVLGRTLDVEQGLFRIQRVENLFVLLQMSTGRSHQAPTNRDDRTVELSVGSALRRATRRQLRSRSLGFAIRIITANSAG